MLQQSLYSAATAIPARGGIHRKNIIIEEITQMKTLVQRFSQLHNDEAGQGLVEYVMLIALVIAAAAACFPGLTNALVQAFQKIGTKLGTYVS
jgi:Flp pilus assembly pilin Flp